jgi:hypothetical protein
MAARLRVFPAPGPSPFGGSPEPTVSIQLGDLLPLIALAQRNNYAWLADFLEDEVRITDDLYEVLQAFRCYRPSA